MLRYDDVFFYILIEQIEKTDACHVFDKPDFIQAGIKIPVQTQFIPVQLKLF